MMRSSNTGCMITTMLRAREGSTIIQFAIVLPAFFLLFFGIFECGIYMFNKVIIETVTADVARLMSTGATAKNDGSVCSDENSRSSREAYITCIVKDRASILINGNKTVVQFQPVANGMPVTPDICFDTNPPSSPATCAGSYEDVNGDHTYKGATETTNAGTEGELVVVRVSYPWMVPFPWIKLGSAEHPNTVMISSSTVIKNEPF